VLPFAHSASERMMETMQTSLPGWRFRTGLPKLDLLVWNERRRLRVSSSSGVLTLQLGDELSDTTMTGWQHLADLADPLKSSRSLKPAPAHSLA
jgi:hypothetical protein